jgi:guanine deaminase
MNQLSPDYYRDETSEQSVSNTQASIDYIRTLDPRFSLLSPIITPRFAPSCTSELLSSLGALAKKENLPIQTHMSENLAETALVKELFPDQPTYAHVYDAHGLLTERTILAHCVHIDAEEIKLCAERGAGIAHCPISNTGLTSGEAKVRWMIEVAPLDFVYIRVVSRLVLGRIVQGVILLQFWSLHGKHRMYLAMSA